MWPIASLELVLYGIKELASETPRSCRSSLIQSDFQFAVFLCSVQESFNILMSSVEAGGELGENKISVWFISSIITTKVHHTSILPAST